MNIDKIKEMYESDLFYAVISSDGLYFIETPGEQGLTEQDTQESLLRLFLSKDEADAYCDYLNVLVGTFSVVSTNLIHVWSLLRDIDEMSMTIHGCTVRVAVCYLDNNYWPQDIDTLYSIFAIPN